MILLDLFGVVLLPEVLSGGPAVHPNPIVTPDAEGLAAGATAHDCKLLLGGIVEVVKLPEHGSILSVDNNLFVASRFSAMQ